MLDIKQIAKNAKIASYELARASSAAKNKALLGMARSLEQKAQAIISENKKDLTASRGKPSAFIDRLRLDKLRLQLMVDSLRQIAHLKDRIGNVIEATVRPNGLWIHKVRVPIGVIGIIYESRPNVTSDCAGLCLKSGNACVLRGGSEAINTNRIIARILKQSLQKSGLPADAINFIDSGDKKELAKLVKLAEYIDLIIPRGGEGLIRFVSRFSRIPVIKHYKGICSVFVDEFADLNMAQDICFNAKVQRPGVCNAMETLLVHKESAGRFLPLMIKKYQSAGVEIRGCARTLKIISNGVKKAREQDYQTEFLSLILAVKVVDSLDEAIRHINHYGSHHSDSIVTENYVSALEFLNRVDSACVYVNASTRFTDGCEFGMGAEIGISTDKIHARGPMALEELTTYKYMIFGNGQIKK